MTPCRLIFIRSFCAVIALSLLGAVPEAFSQEPTEPAEAPTPGGVATGDVIDANSQLPNVEAVLKEFKENAPADVYETGMAAVKEFDALGTELKSTVAAMRREHTLFVNGYTEDRQPYLKLRDKSRALINQTYRRAMDVLDYMPHTDAAKFVVTVLEERFEHDIYNAGTYEGAAKLLDYGVRWTYVVLGAARSATVVGDFNLAENIYKNVEPENLEDEDKRLMGLKDQIKQQFETEQELIKNDPEVLPQAKFVTSRGVIVADLFINEAPSTVANFITLAESGFYDGLDWFQVVDGLLALTGDPLGDGSSRPDRYIADEHGRDVVRMPLAGSLVMAKLPIGNGKYIPNSAGTQFSILFLPLPPITENQTVFGRVTEGMDIVGALRRVDPSEDKKNKIQIAPDRIISCEILNRPETLPEVKYVDPPVGLP